MSEGVPADWNSSNVIRIGLLTDNVFNESKIGELHLMAYNDMKQRLAQNLNMYGYLSNRTHVLKYGSCGFGSPEVTVDAQCEPTIPSEENIIRVERLGVLNDTIIKLTVILWD